MAITVRRIDELMGHTLTKVVQIDECEIRFYRDDGKVVKMLHHQDCCESVEIVDISGDLNMLTGLVVEAEVVTDDTYNPDLPNVYYDLDFQWTFYKIATVNEFVCIRWLGTSNGYYGIEVSINVDEVD